MSDGRLSRRSYCTLVALPFGALLDRFFIRPAYAVVAVEICAVCANAKVTWGLHLCPRVCRRGRGSRERNIEKDQEKKREAESEVESASDRRETSRKRVIMREGQRKRKQERGRGGEGENKGERAKR